MWVTIDQMICLQAIERAGSISMAAEELSRAKSAVHYSVKKLEEQLGFAVVDTGPYRGVLTEKGRQFLLKAQPILDAMEKLKEEAHKIDTGVEMKLAMSASAIFDLKKLNRSIRRLQRKFPDTEIVLHREILSGEKLLKKKVVDVAIFEGLREAEALEYRQIDVVRMHLVISAKHPLFKGAVSREALLRYPQVVQRSTIPDEDSYGVYQLSRRWTVSDLAAKRQIILDGLGWGRLPEHEIKADLKAGELVCLKEIEDATEVPVYIGRLKQNRPGTVLQTLWEMF